MYIDGTSELLTPNLLSDIMPEIPSLITISATLFFSSLTAFKTFDALLKSFNLNSLLFFEYEIS